MGKELIMSNNWPRYIFGAVCLYGVAVYGSYKYGTFTKAQIMLREVKDQRTFLYEKH